MYSPGVRGMMRMMTKGMKVTQSLAVRRSVRTSLGFRMDPCFANNSRGRVIIIDRQKKMRSRRGSVRALIGFRSVEPLYRPRAAAKSGIKAVLGRGGGGRDGIRAQTPRAKGGHVQGWSTPPSDKE